MYITLRFLQAHLQLPRGRILFDFDNLRSKFILFLSQVPWCPLCERATAHEKQTLKVEEILVEDDDADIEETTSETSASAGEDDITFLDMLEKQRASTVEIEDEVSIIFEDNCTGTSSWKEFK